MQGAPQRLWALSGAGQGGSGFQAQIRLHGTHRTRQGTGPGLGQNRARAAQGELMPYCREMARLWGGREVGIGRAGLHIGQVMKPTALGVGRIGLQNKRTEEVSNPGTCPLLGIFHAKLNISKQGSDGLGPLPSRVLWKAYSSQGHLYLSLFISHLVPIPQFLVLPAVRVYPLCGHSDSLAWQPGIGKGFSRGMHN